MTTKMSKLPEIRKQNEISRKDDKVETMSTHEQLRSAHIETLEQLQVLTETNTCLRRSMSVLKLKSSSFNKDDQDSDSQIDPLNDTSDDTVLLNKIRDQEREIKNLKYQVCEADGEMRDFKDQCKLLRQQEFESKRKLEKERSEKEAEVSKNFMASIAILTADNVSLQSTVENRENKIQVLEASKAADEKKHEQLTNQLNLHEQNSREYKESSALSLLNHQNLSNSILQIKNERDNTMTDLEEMKIKVNTLNCNLINLECDKECLTSKVNAGQKETQALHLQVSKLKAEILHLKGENLKLTANCEKGNLQLSTLIASRSVTPPASAPVPSLILVPPTVVSVVESARGGDYRIGGKDYEELTNLKKENKTLKQRIASLQNLKSVTSSSTKSAASERTK